MRMRALSNGARSAHMIGALVPFLGESARPPEALPSDCRRDKKEKRAALLLFGTPSANRAAHREAVAPRDLRTFSRSAGI
jgi:hypothetical protein